MNGIALQHQVIGVQCAKQGAGQTVPEDLVLCIECGWKRLSDYALHLEDLLAAHDARIASDAAEGALRDWAGEPVHHEGAHARFLEGVESARRDAIAEADRLRDERESAGEGES